MIYTHHSSIETHLDAILPSNKSDRLNKSQYHSVTDLSWWHSAWSLACKWSKRNNNNNRINQVENIVFDWWKHIGWTHTDRVINTSTLSTSSSQHHWVIKTSTHQVPQQTEAFGRFTIDWLYIEFGIQCTVDQVFEGLFLFTVLFVKSLTHMFVLRLTILLLTYMISSHKSAIDLRIVDCEILFAKNMVECKEISFAV